MRKPCNCAVGLHVSVLVFIFIVLFAVEFLRYARWVDVCLEVLDVVGEMDFASDYRVEPAANNFPDPWIVLARS